MSRMKNTIRNGATGIIGQVSSTLLSFINRTVFIYFLDSIYLGINGLFSNILSMLSLAELGIGTAIIFKMYKPLATNDERQIKALMNFYKLAYRIIGIVVISLGLLLIPFLDVIVGEHNEILNFTLIYVLYLLNSASTYFFAYKRSLLSADQKEYINSINRVIFLIIQNIGQFIVLYFTKDFLLYLIVGIISTIVSNIRISFICDKKYPYLKNNKEHLSKLERKELYKYTFAQTCHKIGGVVVNGTDNILITVFVKNGLNMVGLYSNYLFILSAIKSILNSLFNSATASIGNLNVTENMEKSKQIFNRMFFINYILFGFVSCCFYVLANDFISIWVGENFLISDSVVAILVLNYYLSGMRQTCITYNTTLGLFWNDRYKPLFEAAINFIASIILINFFGFIGVFLGTVISNLTTNFWVEPYLLYKYGFKTSLSDYFVRYLKYTATTFFAILVVGIIISKINSSNLFMWIIEAFICGITTLIILCIPFIKTDEFRFLYLNFKKIK